MLYALSMQVKVKCFTSSTADISPDEFDIVNILANSFIHNISFGILFGQVVYIAFSELLLNIGACYKYRVFDSFLNRIY